MTTDETHDMVNKTAQQFVPRHIPNVHHTDGYRKSSDRA